MEARIGIRAFWMAVMLFAAGDKVQAGIWGGLPGGGGSGQAIDPVGNGYDAKTQSSGSHQYVAPRLESCRDNGNGTYTATWGYINMSSESVSIPIGSRNKFYPGSADRGQPVIFMAGERTDAFSTTYSGSELTWILDGRTASVQSCNCAVACPFGDSLLIEPWNSFDAAVWQGDGDQSVSGGYFSIRPLAFSAFADWIHPAPVTLEPTSEIHFDQTFRLTYPLVQLMTQSAAVYQVNKDGDGTYTDYAFVNIGYTGLGDNRLFVEIFGADGGVGFDQFIVTDIAAAPEKTIQVDLRIRQNSYSVAVDGTVANTVNLVTPLPNIDLFEVGVQRNLVGLEGAIDATYIYKRCQ